MNRRGISKQNLKAIYPLLPLQEGILYHSLYEPRSRAYFQQACFRLAGDLDFELCEQALNSLVRRHDVLRSVFVHENTSQPLHVILKERPVEFHSQDLRTLSSEDRDALLKAFMENDRNRGFDLSSDVLFRVNVFRLADSLYEMIWSHPHIIIDGWSGAILQTEFCSIYQALRTGRAPELHEPPPYNQYVDWLEVRDTQAARDHWKRVLAGYNTPVSIPADRHAHLDADLNADYALEEHAFCLDADITKAMSKLAVSQGSTLNNFLQCVWAILLARYNDEDDVLFGTVVSGRPPEVEGIENMVGLFINTVPVRVQMGDFQTFCELLSTVQQNAVDREAHQHLSLTEIQSVSELKQDLLNHLFVFENYPVDRQIMEESGKESLGFEVLSAEMFEQAHYDFGLLIYPGEETTIRFTYNANRYSGDRVRRIEDHFRKAVESILSNPFTLLHDIEILPPSEEDQILQGFAGTSVSFPEEKTLADLWEEQVEKTPHNTALLFENRRWTYAELNVAANGIADFLRREYSLAPDDRIGVLMDRTEWQIPALLGILKAGGAYVPIEPSFPDERIGFIVEDSGCRVVLADSINVNHSVVPTAVPVVDAASILPKVEFSPDQRCSSRDLAYVIYTSGSTGRPKGVLIEHRGFVNMILEQIRGFGITADDRVLQFASCSFDASLSEIFMALLSGAALVQISRDIIQDIGRLQDYLTEHSVSVATFPPSYLRAAEYPDLPSLRVLITAGESATYEDARRYVDGLRYFNAYGPTETSVCATYQRITSEYADCERLPIGRALVNTKIRILDSRLRPVPVGICGEIAVAGPGLARGYLNRPETEEVSFAQSPNTHDDRIYRTGDLGRWRPDGTIEFLGRNDDQIKLRGFRIELGEIEEVLLKHPAIAEAVVICRDDVGDEKRLVAYVASKDPIPVSSLNEWLVSRLPAYMIPAHFVWMESLPLTPSLKIDKKSLPRPETASTQEGPDPRTPLESTIAHVWREVLGIDRVGIHDSFFDLGGDSLKAIRVSSRLQKAGYRVSLRDLIDRPTIAEIAGSTAEPVSEPSAGTVTGTVELTPIQRWFFDEHSSDLHHFNHSVLLRAKEPIDKDAVLKALEAVCGHHDILRARYPSSNGTVVQELAPPTESPFLYEIDLRGRLGGVSSLARHLDELHRSFDIKSGPLFKSALYRLNDSDRLLLLLHHLVIDAVSWEFLLEDIARAYGQAVRGEPINLGEKGDSYQTWAASLREYSTSETLLSEKVYWSQVESAPATPPPLDSPLVEHTYGETQSLAITIPMNGKSSGDAGESLDMKSILLTSLARSLQSWHGGDRSRILMTGHGRETVNEQLDVSRTIGWFTSNYPVLLDLQGTRDVVSQLDSIKAAFLETPKNGIGYGILKYLTPPDLKDDSHGAAVPEVSFNYLGQYESESHDGPFVFSERMAHSSIGERFKRHQALELDAMLTEQVLTLHARYSPRFHRRAVIEEFLESFRREMSTVLDHVRNKNRSAGILP